MKGKGKKQLGLFGKKELTPEAERLLANWEVVAGAPRGIGLLRSLIVEYGRRGKLVPQDPRGRTKGTLSHAMEDAKLVPGVAPGAECPTSWGHVLVGDIATVQAGYAFDAQCFNKSGAGLPLIRIRDLRNTETTVWYDGPFRDEFIVHPGDHLIGMDGDFSIVEWRGPIALLNQRVCRLIYTTTMVDRRFVRIVIQSDLDKIHAATSYTTVKHISNKQIAAIALPLPPLAEQERIVAKVDELMMLCDELEARQAKQRETAARLNKVALDALTRAERPEELAEGWQRVVGNLDTLVTVDNAVAELRRAIVELAIRGRLFGQTPVLDEIGEENGSGPPFSLPRTWQWVQLRSLCERITKGSSPNWQGVQYVDGPEDGIVFVTSENVGSGRMLLDKPKYVESKFNEIEPRSILRRGDFLMNIVGASIGRVAIFDADVPANINQAVCLIRLAESQKSVDPAYLLHFLNSPTCISYMFDKQVDNARANLSMGNIAQFLIPLPPLAEQKRIVAKVDQLLSLCDTLEQKLRRHEESARKLAAALVAELLA